MGQLCIRMQSTHVVRETICACAHDRLRCVSPHHGRLAFVSWPFTHMKIALVCVEKKTILRPYLFSIFSELESFNNLSVSIHRASVIVHQLSNITHHSLNIGHSSSIIEPRHVRECFAQSLNRDMIANSLPRRQRRFPRAALTRHMSGPGFYYGNMQTREFSSVHFWLCRFA